MGVVVLKARINGSERIDIDPFNTGKKVTLDVKYDAIYDAPGLAECEESIVLDFKVFLNGRFLEEFSEFLENKIYPGNMVPVSPANESEQQAIIYAIEEAILSYLDEEEYKKLLSG